MLNNYFVIANEVEILHSPRQNSVVTNRRPDISLSTAQIKIVPASIMIKINDKMYKGEIK